MALVPRLLPMAPPQRLGKKSRCWVSLKNQTGAVSAWRNTKTEPASPGAPERTVRNRLMLWRKEPITGIATYLRSIFPDTSTSSRRQVQYPRNGYPGTDGTACFRDGGETADLPGPSGDGGPSGSLHSSSVEGKGESFRIASKMTNPLPAPGSLQPRNPQSPSLLACQPNGMIPHPSSLMHGVNLTCFRAPS